jgi:hypothetical protein
MLDSFTSAVKAQQSECFHRRVMTPNALRVMLKVRRVGNGTGGALADLREAAMAPSPVVQRCLADSASFLFDRPLTQPIELLNAQKKKNFRRMAPERNSCH